MKSPEFISFGNQWIVHICPGGNYMAKRQHLSLEHCSNKDNSVQFNLLRQNTSGGAVTERNGGSHKFLPVKQSWGCEKIFLLTIRS